MPKKKLSDFAEDLIEAFVRARNFDYQHYKEGSRVDPLWVQLGYDDAPDDGTLQMILINFVRDIIKIDLDADILLMAFGFLRGYDDRSGIGERRKRCLLCSGYFKHEDADSYNKFINSGNRAERLKFLNGAINKLSHRETRLMKRMALKIESNKSIIKDYIKRAHAGAECAESLILPRSVLKISPEGEWLRMSGYAPQDAGSDRPEPAVRGAGTSSQSAGLPDIFDASMGKPKPKTVRPDIISGAADLVPPELLDRAAELRMLADACKNKSGYFIVNAKAFSGKTALLSWFFTYPPADASVIGFFIRGNIASYSDSDFFKASLAAQLEAYTGSVDTSGKTISELLAEAAAIAARGGKRLVLIVDAIDEDQSQKQDKQPILELLPRLTIPNLVVVLSARPLPDIKAHTALGYNHPIKKGAVLNLEQLPFIIELERKANDELKRLRDNVPLSVPVISLLAVSRGALSEDDLSEITGELPIDIASIFANQTGRIFLTAPGEAAVFSSARQKAGYTFGHDIFREQAESAFVGKEKQRYMNMLNEWGDSYKDRRWPLDTPRYLLTDYLGMLASEWQWERLADILSDSGYIDLIFRESLPNAAYARYIQNALEALTENKKPDLLRIALLSQQRERVKRRSSSMPLLLPATIAMLGYYELAESITDALPSYDARFGHRVLVARAMDEKGRADKAVPLVIKAVKDFHETPDKILSVDYCGGSLLSCVKILHAAGEHDRAADCLRQIWTLILSDGVNASRAIIDETIDLFFACSDSEYILSEIERFPTEGSDKARLLVAAALAQAAAGDNAGAKQSALKAIELNTEKQADIVEKAAVALTRISESVSDSLFEGIADVPREYALARAAIPILEALLDRNDTVSALEKLNYAKSFFLKTIASAAGGGDIDDDIDEDECSFYLREAEELEMRARGVEPALLLGEPVDFDKFGFNYYRRMFMGLDTDDHREKMESLLEEVLGQFNRLVEVGDKRINQWFRFYTDLLQIAGMLYDAKAAVAWITTDIDRASCLASVACGLAKTGKTDDAEMVVREIYLGMTNPLPSHPSMLIHALIDTGRHEMAAGCVALMDDPDKKAGGYLEIAEALLAAGEKHEARIYIEKAAAICPESPKDSLYATALLRDFELELNQIVRISDMQLETGDTEEALKTLRDFNITPQGCQCHENMKSLYILAVTKGINHAVGAINSGLDDIPYLFAWSWLVKSGLKMADDETVRTAVENIMGKLDGLQEINNYHNIRFIAGTLAEAGAYDAVEALLSSLDGKMTRFDEGSLDAIKSDILLECAGSMIKGGDVKNAKIYCGRARDIANKRRMDGDDWFDCICKYARLMLEIGDDEKFKHLTGAIKRFIIKNGPDVNRDYAEGYIDLQMRANAPLSEIMDITRRVGEDSLRYLSVTLAKLNVKHPDDAELAALLKRACEPYRGFFDRTRSKFGDVALQAQKITPLDLGLRESFLELMRTGDKPWVEYARLLTSVDRDVFLTLAKDYIADFTASAQ